MAQILCRGNVLVVRYCDASEKRETTASSVWLHLLSCLSYDMVEESGLEEIEVLESESDFFLASTTTPKIIWSQKSRRQSDLDASTPTFSDSHTLLSCEPSRDAARKQASLSRLLLEILNLLGHGRWPLFLWRGAISR